jgi:hypothetical protein
MAWLLVRPHALAGVLSPTFYEKNGHSASHVPESSFAFQVNPRLVV